MTGDAAALSRHTGTDLLFPSPEGVCASTTIGIGSHEMPTWPEVTVDHAVRREEPLRLSRRLEPLYLPLSPSGGPMRILGTIIEITACPVAGIGHDLPMRNTVTAQAVGDEAPRLVLQPLQKALEEALRRGRIPAILHEDVEHDPVLIHRPPEIVQRAIDLDEHLVEVPGVSRPGPPPPEPLGEVRTEFPALMPDTLVGHDHAALGQDQLDVSQTETEDVIQPDCVAESLGVTASWSGCPPICISRRARRMRARASSWVARCTISLAIMES